MTAIKELTALLKKKEHTVEEKIEALNLVFKLHDELDQIPEKFLELELGDEDKPDKKKPVKPKTPAPKKKN